MFCFKFVVWTALLVGGFCTVGYLCKMPTRSFALCKISSSLQANQEWETAPLMEEGERELEKALSQPYHFLSKGAQAFVFKSEDGRYVIKFFKLHHLQPSVWLRMLRWPWCMESYRLEKMVEKRRELFKTFMSYKIA